MSLPRGIPDRLLTVQRRRELVEKVDLSGDSLKVYDLKRQMGYIGQRLRNYCNVCTFYTSFHDGKNGSKSRVLNAPEDCCPKFFAVAQAVAGNSQKAVVMTGRTSGHVVMLELLKQMAARSTPPFQVATMSELSEFNHVSNLRGEKYRVLVADSSQCSEGVSFLTVRRVFLTDVPSLHSQFVQQCGRAIRMYGHRGLPEEEQTVLTKLYVATLPKWMRSQLECWAFRAQSKNAAGQEVEKRARLLAARLRKVGIETLDELKERIDAHGAATYDLKSQPVGKERLSTEDVLVFLEQNGLFEEAKLLQHTAKREREKANRTWKFSTGTTESSNQAAGQPGDAELAKSRERPVQQAIQSLYLAGSIEDSSLALRMETADEEALQELARQAHELAPALAGLRAQAIDRGVVNHQVVGNEKDCLADEVEEEEDDALDVMDEDPDMRDTMMSYNANEETTGLERVAPGQLREPIAAYNGASNVAKSDNSNSLLPANREPVPPSVGANSAQPMKCEPLAPSDSADNMLPMKRSAEIAMVDKRIRLRGKVTVRRPCAAEVESPRHNVAKEVEAAMQVDSAATRTMDMTQGQIRANEAESSIQPQADEVMIPTLEETQVPVRRRMRGKCKPHDRGV